MAGRAASLRKALALLAGSCWAAACASCACVTASATLRSAAGSGVLRPVPPSARHGAAGSAKRCGGWGSGRYHMRQVRNGRGVPQVHVDPQEGGARRAHAFV